MAHDWQVLTQLTRGAALLVERVRLVENGVSVEGSFEPPPLARLSAEDQVFVAAFVKCHGSIKQMEKYFGVSYPTIKNRLNRIGETLSFVEIQSDEAPPPSDVLKRLEDGALTVEQALEELNARRAG
jgi:hypothetical protein